MRTFLLILLFIVGCNGAFNSSREIYGTWQNTGTSGDTITFNRDGTLSGARGKFDLVNSVEPKQIYMIVDHDGELKRYPFGIYDIKGDKLIIGVATVYEKTYGGISFGGVTRSEFPKDFSGEVLEYKFLR